MKYRPEIDGLRAIAVMSVILSHASFAAFEGGFIGVDVFFVISGYLITSIILDEYVRGDFSLARFYERRAKRILPALFVVLVCCAIMAWFWLLPGAYEAFSKSLMLAALSFSNFYFLKKNDYFAPDAAEVPLLHTWSLGVEEQFYMLFPLLFLFRLKLRTIFIIVAGLAVASLIASEIGAWRFPSANYYLLTTRAWEILTGSLCAFYVFGKKRHTSGILSSLGLALIIASIFAFEPETRVPSIAALLPVGGTALFLLFSSGESFVGRLLSWAPVVWIGRISFSAYLWHQPVFAFWRIRNLEPPSVAIMCGLILLVLILAASTWLLVEQPFRHSKATMRGVATTVTACLVIFVGFGTWGARDGLSFRLAPEVKKFMEATTWSGECLFQTTDGIPSLPADKCMFNVDGASKTYAVWGDSISASIAPALSAKLQQSGTGLVQLTHGFCAPIIGVWNARHERAANCDIFNRRAMDYLLASNVEVVVLAASWANFFNAKYMYVDGVELEGADITVPALARNLKATMERLEKAGKRVAVVYPTPRFSKAIEEVMAATIIKGDVTPDFTYPLNTFKADTARAYSILDTAINGDLVEKVLPEIIFCGPIASGICYFGRDGVAYIADKSHYTHKGAEIIADHIMDELATDEHETESAAIQR
jgi:peptidoglycan/LPS O-acetylase OafA/YrhL